MKLIELLKELQDSKKGVFINELGLGKIIGIESDFISFEVIKTEKIREGKTEKTKIMGEVIIIPIDKIKTISEGQKEKQKSSEDKDIDKELGVI